MTKIVRDELVSLVKARIAWVHHSSHPMPADAFVDRLAKDIVDHLPKSHADMLPVLERVREALKFYATCKSENSWEEFWADVKDGGGKAQQALTELEAIMKGGSE